MNDAPRCGPVLREHSDQEGPRRFQGQLDDRWPVLSFRTEQDALGVVLLVLRNQDRAEGQAAPRFDLEDKTAFPVRSSFAPLARQEAPVRVWPGGVRFQVLALESDPAHRG